MLESKMPECTAFFAQICPLSDTLRTIGTKVFIVSAVSSLEENEEKTKAHRKPLILVAYPNQTIFVRWAGRDDILTLKETIPARFPIKKKGYVSFSSEILSEMVALAEIPKKGLHATTRLSRVPALFN